MDSTDIIKDNVLETTEPIKRGRGRPRKQEEDKIVKQDRTGYMHAYYKTHYSPKPRIINPDVHYGRPVKTDKLTADMKEYQRLYRQKQKMKKSLETLD
jgi:hypothetical protein